MEKTELGAELDRLEAALDTDRLPTESPTTPLFHYTDAKGLQGILEKRTIWATDYRFLNDTREICIGEDLLQAVADALRDRHPAGSPEHQLLAEFAQLYPKDRLTQIAGVFIASFSEEGDLLSQWRAYGAQGGGYSLGFSSINWPNAGDEAATGVGLFRCEYKPDRLRAKMEDRLRLLLDSFGLVARGSVDQPPRALFGRFLALLLRHAAMLALTLKHEAFEEEREWRLVAMGDTRDLKVEVLFRPATVGVVPYVELPLSTTDRLDIAKLYVGPTQESGRGRATAQLLLDRYGYNGKDIVSPSSVPFRGAR